MSREPRLVGRFAALLGALLCVMIAIHVWPAPGGGGVGVRLGLSAVLVTGLYAASRRRWVLWIGLLFALPALSAEWTTQFVPTQAGSVARMILTSLFLFYTSGVVLHAVLSQERVSADTVLGGINVYLLLGIAFMMVHRLLETLQPGSYVFNGTDLAGYLAQNDGLGEVSTMLYFSFTSLTTLGYGDIRPATSISQLVSVGEAILGQLYVAIFIARLVGLHLAHAMAAKR